MVVHRQVFCSDFNNSQLNRDYTGTKGICGHNIRLVRGQPHAQERELDRHISHLDSVFLDRAKYRSIRPGNILRMMMNAYIAMLNPVLRKEAAMASR